MASILCAIAMTFVFAPPALAQNDCPISRTDDRAPDELQYKWRNDRCEGLYRVTVSGGGRPQLVGFHSRAFSRSSLAEVEELSFEIERPGSAAVSLRARDLRPRTYYAMDTDLSAGEKRYKWDATIVRSLGPALRGSELAVVACDNGCRPESATRYYPASMSSASGTAGVGMVAIITSPTGLKNIRYRVRNEDGAKVLEREYSREFAAEQPISVRLGTLAPGTYRLEFFADYRASGSPTRNTFVLVIP